MRSTTAVRADDRGLDLPLSKLPGVGAKTGKALHALGLQNVGDLLHHVPRRYLKRGQLTAMTQVQEGDHVVVSARVISAEVRPMRQRHGVLMQCRITDGEQTLDLTFFARHANVLSHHQRVLTPGSTHFFSGTVSSYRGKLQLTHPEFEPAEDVSEADFLRPVPVYPASSGITTWALARLIRTVLDAVVTDADLDVLPAEYRAAHHLPGGRDVAELVHNPATEDEARAGRRALAHEEAFVLQTALAQRRTQAEEELSQPRPQKSGGLREAFDASLPFTLTEGQQEVGEKIAADLASPIPMMRLLQGDVGAGKTVVAVRAMLQVLDAGGQAVLLAPTEVLAFQHQRSLQALLGSLPIRVVTVTGSLGTRPRRQALAHIASGEAGIIVGTHALFNAEVLFDDLGLVVIDEQHRFGVQQREVLRTAGKTAPHLLHMTATPIPRTVAMTVFGDLDLTDLPGLPSGRTPVETVLVDEDNERWMQRVWQRTAEEVAGGGRVFVVAPRIEENDDQETPSEDRRLHTVAETVQRLGQLPLLAGVAVGALHGRMAAEDKDEAMARFVRGETPVLVSTTVIEVGVDVAEASLMVILDADRFGLAQLHQLRGRVGRGQRTSLCLAVAPGTIAPTSLERLTAFASTTDGFRLAEMDVSLRAEGNVLGAQQSGRRSSLKALNVQRDGQIIGQARRGARAIVAQDPTLASHAALAAAVRRRLDVQAATYLDAS